MLEHVPPKQAFEIKRLGPCHIDSPMKKTLNEATQAKMFVPDDEELLYNGIMSLAKGYNKPLEEMPAFELAGPREKIYFDPSKTRVGIVTCGGLCPGLNDVIRGVVLELWHIYGVRMIYGFKYGFQGMVASYGHPVLDLNPEEVDGIQDLGGTLLASSRGRQSEADMVDCLERMGISILFVIGGDGSQKGGSAIADEIEKRHLKISVVGIPKTIDNDIMYVGESFGFQTAYSKAVEVLRCAHVEAIGAPNGVGLVKLMGRESGFIACHAALAMSDVNFVLIPEVPFDLEGPNGFLASLERRLDRRHHAVVVVAEGAGQDLLAATGKADASGNVKLGDIGLYLKEKVNEHFKKIGKEVNLKYMDPSYVIRSVPASPQDSIYCRRLSQMAVHAAMCGKTEMVVGRWHGHFIHIPTDLTTSGRLKVDPDGDLWLAILESTGQPSEMR